METIREEANELVESMQTSQFVISPVHDNQREVTTTLEKITTIVNQQTIKGYKSGYDDGFQEGIIVGKATGFLNGMSATLIAVGLIMIIREKL